MREYVIHNSPVINPFDIHQIHDNHEQEGN